jgi:hypothetical protein
MGSAEFTVKGRESKQQDDHERMAIKKQRRYKEKGEGEPWKYTYRIYSSLPTPREPSHLLGGDGQSQRGAVRNPFWPHWLQPSKNLTSMKEKL